jgi:PAS domain S-box-containing protein
MSTLPTYPIHTVSYLATIVDSMPTAIVVADQAGTIVLVNTQTEILFGYARDEILGKQVEILLPDQFRRRHPDLRLGFMHHPKTRPMGAGRDLYGLRKDGSQFPVEIGLNPVTTTDGLFIVSAIVDITERKRQTEALEKSNLEFQRSESRFRVMFDNSAVGMSMIGLDGKIITANPALCRMLGRTLGELIGETPVHLTYVDDIAESRMLYEDLISGKTNHYVAEQRFLRKDGEVFWVQVSRSMVRDRGGEPLYIMGLITDIDNQKKAQANLAEQEARYRRTLEQRVEERTHALAETNERLQDEIKQRANIEAELAKKAADEAVTAERTRLARDLHDAVTQTLFASSMIAEVLPDLWEVDVEEAKKSTEELQQLTRGALAEMRTLLLELRPVALTQARLGDLIKQLCEAFIGRSRLPIELNIEGDGDLSQEVLIAFYRIAQESLNNVFKYARASRVDVSLFISSSSVHFETRDNGVGFDLSTTKPTSLGMRIMRERAEAIGADLEISSKLGAGTSVEITWNENPKTKPESLRNFYL